VSAQPAAGMFISAITEAELRYGLALLPDGQCQRRLLAQAEAMLAEEFASRILPFDSAAASAYAPIAAARRAPAARSRRPTHRSPRLLRPAAPLSQRGMCL
jgi:toxin FitB